MKKWKPHFSDYKVSSMTNVGYLNFKFRHQNRPNSKYWNTKIETIVCKLKRRQINAS